MLGDPAVAHVGDDGLLARGIDRQSGTYGGEGEGSEATLDDNLAFLAAGQQRGATAQLGIVGVTAAAGAEIDHVGQELVDVERGLVNIRRGEGQEWIVRAGAIAGLAGRVFAVE